MATIKELLQEVRPRNPGGLITSISIPVGFTATVGYRGEGTFLEVTSLRDAEYTQEVDTDAGMHWQTVTLNTGVVLCRWSDPYGSVLSTLLYNPKSRQPQKSVTSRFEIVRRNLRLHAELGVPYKALIATMRETGPNYVADAIKLVVWLSEQAADDLTLQSLLGPVYTDGVRVLLLRTPVANLSDNERYAVWQGARMYARVRGYLK